MKEILRLCMVLTVIAAVSAGVLAFVSQKTAEPIEIALREEMMSAVRKVLPPFDNDPDKDTRTIGSGADTVKFYRGRKGGAVVGAAFSVTSPNGYSGEIEIMVGVDTAGVVQGIEILQHRETPGLGAKIEEGEFKTGYKGKSLTDPETWDVIKDGGTFKQITGATISSRAVTRAVSRGLNFFTKHRANILSLGAPAPLSPPILKIRAPERDGDADSLKAAGAGTEEKRHGEE
jgi:electron transport complex protein RnfG